MERGEGKMVKALVLKSCVFVMLLTLQLQAQQFVSSNFCAEAILELQKSEPLTNAAYLAELNRIQSGTNEWDSAGARLVLALAQYDLYENSMESNCLSECAALCTNVIAQASLPDRSWLKCAAVAVQVTTLACEGKFGLAYSACTNALARNLSSPSTQPESQLWAAIVRRHAVDGLSVANALNFYAALSLLFQDPAAGVSTYTQFLPTNCLEKIQLLQAR